MALDDLLKERLERASRELESALVSVRELDKLSAGQANAVEKLGSAAEWLKRISEDSNGAIVDLKAVGAALSEAVSVLKSADPRPSLQATEQALSRLSDRSAATERVLVELQSSLVTQRKEIETVRSSVEIPMQALSKKVNLLQVVVIIGLLLVIGLLVVDRVLK